MSIIYITSKITIPMSTAFSDRRLMGKEEEEEEKAFSKYYRM